MWVLMRSSFLTESGESNAQLTFRIGSVCIGFVPPSRRKGDREDLQERPLVRSLEICNLIWVLFTPVGPTNFRNLSDNCQKTVRKLSVTKICQKTVLNVSEFCQKTVRCKYLSEIYQKRFGNASEMCQIL